ncbi:MAG: aminoglycoside phosphotransferase family protein, partial [Candidatus Uhrbacteria bacterium]|nr:aminoglycoside phosphotransferase family protein [Candidatus Uhrbacteria bacterium]
IDGETFELLLARQRGALLYANVDRSKYLRIGESARIAKELKFHKQILAFGFPVAQILGEGKNGGFIYWIEESLGKEHFGDRFFRETKEDGRILDDSFRAFLQIVKQAHDAQERILETKPIDSVALAKGVGFEDILLELPEEGDKLHLIWEKILADLQGYPFCVTHGDFLPNNILEHGVIDFGDHFYGPAGYDIINAITVAWWFPKEDGFEYRRRWSFTDQQIEEYFNLVSTYKENKREWNILQKFDSLFFMRATWWAVRNHPAPKLQAWRYERYRILINRLSKGESLLDYWREHKDD